jgi:hypothetical protein
MSDQEKWMTTGGVTANTHEARGCIPERTFTQSDLDAAIAAELWRAAEVCKERGTYWRQAIDSYTCKNFPSVRDAYDAFACAANDLEKHILSLIQPEQQAALEQRVSLAVAGAYADAADIAHMEFIVPRPGETLTFTIGGPTTEERIRSRTPADAVAALSHRDDQTYDEGFKAGIEEAQDRVHTASWQEGYDAAKETYDTADLEKHAQDALDAYKVINEVVVKQRIEQETAGIRAIIKSRTDEICQWDTLCQQLKQERDTLRRDLADCKDVLLVAASQLEERAT